MPREQRRLVAIVSADVAGYSRLMGRDESGTLAALKALRRDVIDPKVSEHGGRIVKTAGDDLLLEFPSVVDAVRCVVEVQTAMAEEYFQIPAIELEEEPQWLVDLGLKEMEVDWDRIAENEEEWISYWASNIKGQG